MRGGGEDRARGRLSRLPPGRHGLPREFVTENQRGRITAGMIAAVAEHGYNETTISQIATAAGLSRRTFYGFFPSKEEAFFDVYDQIAEYLRRAATEADKPQPDWPSRVRARLAAILDVFAANPDLARFVLVVPPRAGHEIAGRYRRAMEEVLQALTEGMPPEIADRRPSTAVEHGLVGGGVALIVAKVEAGEGERLPEVLPDLFELALTPYLGRETAVSLARKGA